MKKRVLITGHEGYIGSVMAPVFMADGYQVVGLDNGYFRDCNLVAPSLEIHSLAKDIRDVQPADLEGFTTVIHLAGLSNDPIGNINAEWTEDINFKASVELAQNAKVAGVERFLFSSSCIMYGMSDLASANEESPLDPQTEYARSKVKSEIGIGELAGDGFSPTFLRNGTVYGLSPRMRFDTVLNDLVASAVTTGKIILYSDGTPWRPVVHVEDVARSFLHVAEAPIEAIHGQAFNNGSEHLNYRIIQLAEMVAETVPDCEVEVRGETSADQRTYQADFRKFARTFPDFEFKWSPRTGAQELYQAFKDVELTHADFQNPKFTRLKWLRYLLDTGRVDASLRWDTNRVTAL